MFGSPHHLIEWSALEAKSPRFVMEEAYSPHPPGSQKFGCWSQASPCGIYGKCVAWRFFRIGCGPRRKWSWTYGLLLSAAYKGSWTRFAAIPTMWSLPVCAFGKNGGTRLWWLKEEVVRGGTTSPHAGCFRVTCRPPCGVGPRRCLVLAKIDGHHF